MHIQIYVHCSLSSLKPERGASTEQPPLPGDRAAAGGAVQSGASRLRLPALDSCQTRPSSDTAVRLGWPTTVRVWTNQSQTWASVSGETVKHVFW